MKEELAKLDSEIEALRLKLAEDRRPTRNPPPKEGGDGKELPEASAIRADRRGLKDSRRRLEARRAEVLEAMQQAELAAMTLEGVEAEMQSHRSIVRSSKARLRALAEARSTKVLEAEIARMDPAARARLKRVIG